MENINRYKGRVIKLGKNCAFIDRATVVNLDGVTHLATEHDIFVHKNDFVGEEFTVGMDLSFEVKIDSRSRHKNAFRAQKALMSGVELQFPELVIDHPTVPVTWCFKPAVLEYIKSRPDHTFALVIGAVMPDAPSRTKVLEMNIGLDAIKNGAAFVSFYAPGNYEVYVYLVEYKYRERNVKKAYAEVDACRLDPKTECGHVTIDHGYDLPFLGHRDIEGRVVSISALTLSVPDGIFAKPMTGRTLRWFEYFWDNDLLDDCDRRGKQWFAFTLGIPAFIVWELLKRVYFFVWGVLSFLNGFHPGFAWKETFSGDLSSDHSSVKYATRKSLMEYQGWKQLLRPSTLVLIILLSVAPFLVPWVWVLYVLIAAAVVAIFLGLIIWRRYFHKTEEEVIGKKWEDFEEALVCGTQPAKKPLSVRLMWSGIKRNVCRTYKKT